MPVTSGRQVCAGGSREASRRTASSKDGNANVVTGQHGGCHCGAAHALPCDRQGVVPTGYLGDLLAGSAAGPRDESLPDLGAWLSQGLDLGCAQPNADAAVHDGNGGWQRPL